MKYVIVVIVVLALGLIVFGLLKMKKGKQGNIGASGGEHKDQFNPKTVIGGGPSIDNPAPTTFSDNPTASRPAEASPPAGPTPFGTDSTVPSEYPAPSTGGDVSMPSSSGGSEGPTSSDTSSSSDQSAPSSSESFGPAEGSGSFGSSSSSPVADQPSPSGAVENNGPVSEDTKGPDNTNNTDSTV